MIKHQILLSSSYSRGSRICLDYPDCDYSIVKDAIDRVSSAYDGKRVSFSTHTIHTDSVDWSSVVEKDPYFDDVKVVDTVDEFVKIIQEDRYLDGIDVAKYILTKEACTHTKVEKLTYMCYADYLCSTGKKLFEDRVFAFKYGPVVDSVYKAFREHSKEKPSTAIDDMTVLSKMNLSIQMRSRILFAEDGEEKLASIERTLGKYKSISGMDLVDLTHRENTPWEVTVRGRKDPFDGKHLKIRDSYIKKYHCFEELV